MNTVTAKMKFVSPLIMALGIWLYEVVSASAAIGTSM